MLKLVSLLFLVLINQAYAETKKIDVVYGVDNRKEVYEVTNPLFLKLARSTAGMVKLTNLKRESSSTDKYTLENTLTLGVTENLCTSEKYIDQPVATECSAFLIGEDTLVTAGHCFIGRSQAPDMICKNAAWIFDFEMKNKKTDATKGISAQNIYTCKEIIEAKRDIVHDYAIVRLSRKVVGREPLKYRTSGKIPSTTKLVVIGHPNALPTKITDGGKIIDNSDSVRFVTNLDTFQGNSGSAVFDAETGMIEGILTEGKTDYRPSNPRLSQSCQVLNKCQEDARRCDLEPMTDPAGEMVTRITSLSSAILKASRR